MRILTLDDVAILYGQRVERNFYLTGTVLLVYDHLLTLKSEMRYIWTPGHMKTSAWYLLVRYFALCANVAMFALPFGNFPTTICVGLVVGHDLSVALQVLLTEMTLALRMLAMYSVGKRAILVFTIVSMIGLALGTWSIVESTPPQVYRTSLPGCYTASSNTRSGLRDYGKPLSPWDRTSIWFSLACVGSRCVICLAHLVNILSRYYMTSGFRVGFA
ncbi:hypothetical protein K438DRAFT_1765506 [Mycena galopus ATCC 62051]|nr:hypothetical protein K438DRAFT_1765506 [Mycena galopus ATCC 62051]